MNLISNCCLVGDFCEIKKVKFFTPFVWNTFFIPDIKTLIENYETLDFDNIELTKYKNTQFLGIKIDNKVNCYFIHYLYGPNDLIKNNYNKEVRGKQIFDYIINSYIRRKTRIDLSEQPKFLFITDRLDYFKITGKHETPEEWNEIIKLLDDKRYKAIIFTKFDLVGTKYVKIIKECSDHPRTVCEKHIKEIENL